MKKIFPCNSCGACCRHVSHSELTSYLDRGDGTCINYDDISKLCTIYETRPDICRVDVGYKKIFKSIYSWDEYVKLNLEACEILQKNKSL